MTRQTGSTLLDGRSALVHPVVALGRGGWGRHAREVLDHLEGLGATVEVGPLLDDRPASARTDRLAWLGSSPARALEEYDAWCAATRPPGPGTEAVVAFPGAALRIFETAPPGVRRVLVTTSLHPRTHRRWGVEALRRAPIERSWLTRELARRIEREAELADVLVTNSALTSRSYADDGGHAGKVEQVDLSARDLGRPAEPDPPVDVLYVGAISVEKGVVDLLRAFRAVGDPSLRLRLMGGPRSAGMARYLRWARRRDRRVVVGPGDPGRQLPTTRVLVHPSYADSFAYSVAEGIAAGLPVLTTDRVGAADLVTAGGAHPDSGLVVAGDVPGLTRRLRDVLGTT